jgi:hypothetical protein
MKSFPNALQKLTSIKDGIRLRALVPRESFCCSPVLCCFDSVASRYSLSFGVQGHARSRDLLYLSGASRTTPLSRLLTRLTVYDSMSAPVASAMHIDPLGCVTTSWHNKFRIIHMDILLHITRPSIRRSPPTHLMGRPPPSAAP